MLTAVYAIRDCFKKLNKMQESIKPNTELDNIKIRIDYEFKNLLLASQEMRYIMSGYTSEEMLECYLFLKEEYSKFIKVEDIETLSNNLKNMLSNFNESFAHLYLIDEDLINYQEWDFVGRERYKCKEDHNAFDLSKEVLIPMAKMFKSNNRKVNILDCASRCGRNMEAIKDNSSEAIEAYAIEKDLAYANSDTSKRTFNKIAKGGFSGSRISNNVFDVVFHYPTISYFVDYNTYRTPKVRTELDELRTITKYLRQNGLLMFCIPAYRISSSMATFIAKNFKDVKIHKIDNEQLALITGLRKLDKEDSEHTAAYFSLLRNAFITMTKLPHILDNIEPYVLPNMFLEIETFRGAILDDDEIKDIVFGTGLYDNFLESQSNILDEMSEQQPLLPFNIGQIGLVLTSGCLDGAIEELDGQYHVIKGMVKKEELTETTREDGNVEVKTTFVNKVQINIMTPNGDFKTLA